MAKGKSVHEAKPPSGLTFEQAFHELESVVERLESGELQLEQSLVLFERGQALAARCTALLEKAELRLRQLVGEGGETKEADLYLEDR